MYTTRMVVEELKVILPVEVQIDVDISKRACIGFPLRVRTPAISVRHVS